MPIMGGVVSFVIGKFFVLVTVELKNELYMNAYYKLVVRES